jgi:hypothetical protein
MSAEILLKQMEDYDIIFNESFAYKFLVYRGLGGDRENIGSYDNFDAAEAAIKRRLIKKKKKYEPIAVLGDNGIPGQITSVDGLKPWVTWNYPNKQIKREKMYSMYGGFIKDTEDNRKILAECIALDAKEKELRKKLEKIPPDVIAKHFDGEKD